MESQSLLPALTAGEAIGAVLRSLQDVQSIPLHSEFFPNRTQAKLSCFGFVSVFLAEWNGSNGNPSHWLEQQMSLLAAWSFAACAQHQVEEDYNHLQTLPRSGVWEYSRKGSSKVGTGITAHIGPVTISDISKITMNPGLNIEGETRWKLYLALYIPLYFLGVEDRILQCKRNGQSYCFCVHGVGSMLLHKSIALLSHLCLGKKVHAKWSESFWTLWVFENTIFLLYINPLTLQFVSITERGTVSYTTMY